MKIKKRTKIILCATVIGIVLLLGGLSAYEKYSYNRLIYEPLFYHAHDTGVTIEYKGTNIECSEYKLRSEYFIWFHDHFRSPYFGKVETKDSIRITIPGSGILSVYPHDEESVVIVLDREFGLTRCYKNSFASFNEHIARLYDITGDDVFADG